MAEGLHDVQVPGVDGAVDPEVPVLIEEALLFVVVIVDCEIDAGIEISDKNNEKHQLQKFE